MPYGVIFAQTLLQRIPAGARVVVKAIKARAPMLVVNPGVMVSRSVCNSQVVRQHRCSNDGGGQHAS